MIGYENLCIYNYNEKDKEVSAMSFYISYNPIKIKTSSHHFQFLIFAKKSKILSQKFKKNKGTKKPSEWKALFCDPAGTRTQDHYIKSVMLYQLSYGIFCF